MLRTYGLPKESRASHAHFLKSHGFDSVVLGPDETPLTIQPALDANLHVWSCRPAFSVRHLPSPEAAPYLSQDPDGHPLIWFGSGCPNQPALRQAHVGVIEQLARSGHFAGFMLDGIRFASPTAAEGFFTCFCAECARKADELALDFDRMRRGAAALRDDLASAAAPLAASPAAFAAALAQRLGAAAWLRFRAACITEHVREVRAAVDRVSQQTGRRFLLGAYLFTPSFAPLVGQDYRALVPLLDIISPMIYRTLGGDSTLAAEWSSLARINALPTHGEFSVDDVEAEVAAARALVPAAGAELVPILRLTDNCVGDVTRAALDAGADGLDYFIFRPEHESYVTEAAQAFTGETRKTRSS